MAKLEAEMTVNVRIDGLPEGMSRRFTPRMDDLELRVADKEGTAGVVSGHAAVFFDGTKRTEFELFEGLVERIAPTAFDNALKNKRDDVRALFNHSPDNLLGRTAAGTLRLRTDKIGLAFDVDLPDTPLGEQVRASVKRGDLTGASFSFRTDGLEHETVKGVDIRTVTDVQLFDVGPVTFPAYEATDVAARSAYDAWRQSIDDVVKRYRARRHALRTVQLDLMR